MEREIYDEGWGGQIQKNFRAELLHGKKYHAKETPRIKTTCKEEKNSCINIFLNCTVNTEKVLLCLLIDGRVEYSYIKKS